MRLVAAASILSLIMLAIDLTAQFQQLALQLLAQAPESIGLSQHWCSIA